MTPEKPLTSLSITLSERTGGRKGYTVCARLWEGRLEGRPGYTLGVKIVNILFHKEENHCRASWLKRSKQLV